MLLFAEPHKYEAYTVHRTWWLRPLCQETFLENPPSSSRQCVPSPPTFSPSHLFFVFSPSFWFRFRITSSQGLKGKVKEKIERRQHTVEQDEGSRSGCRVGFLSPFGVHPLRLRNPEKWGWRDAQGLRSLPGLLEGSSLFPGDHTGQLTAACSSRSGTLFWLLRVLGYAPLLLTLPFSPPPPICINKQRKESKSLEVREMIRNERRKERKCSWSPVCDEKQLP